MFVLLKKHCETSFLFPQKVKREKHMQKNSFVTHSDTAQ